MTDFTDKQAIYNAITAHRFDNPAMYALSQQIATKVTQLTKEVAKLQETARKAKRKAQLERQDTVKVPESVQEALDALDIHSTDTELRTAARALLISKLQSKDISASEFAQFKDVFGLANASDDLNIELVMYTDLITECPSCGEPVHRPVIDGVDGV